MNHRLICTSAFMVLLALITSTPCSGRGPQPAGLKSESAPRRYASYVSMIKSAIEDEMVFGTNVETARRYGVESAGQVSLNLDVLVAPFIPARKGFSTHVIYLVPGYGYVIRQVSVYPKEKLALFWLGYSAQGPGTDTGFNCTHSHSNCKIEDITFGNLRSAFRSWWLASLKVEIGNRSVAEGAKRRNARRAKLIEQSLNAASH